MKKVGVLLIAFVFLFSSCGTRDKSNHETYDNNKKETTTNIDPEEKNTEVEKPLDQNTEKLPDNLGLPGGIQLPLNRDLIINPEIDNNDTIKWSSSNPDAVSVENNGKITPLAVGESIITASIDDAEGKCRVIVSENPNTLVYKKDPGFLNEGMESPTDNGGENFPLMVPEDITELNNSDLNEADILWEFLINDSLDTELTIPNLGISYMVHSRVKLNAQKQDGGFSPFGDYKGTLEVESEIDEESFLKAMKSLGDFPIETMNSFIDSKKMDVSFTVESYNPDAIDKAKYAYAPKDTVPVVPLLSVSGMVISEGKTSVSADIEMIGEEGYGHGMVSNQAGSVPFVIEIYGDGKVTLFLPRMLSMTNRNWYNGELIKLPILWLK